MYFPGTATCLIYGILNLLDLFICIGLSLTLLLDRELSEILSMIVSGYILYTHIIYTIILTILGVFLVGDFTNIILKRSFEKKCFFTKLAIMAYLIIWNFIFGSCLLYFFIRNYLVTKDECVKNASCVLVFIAVFDLLLYACIHRLHPDLWHFKRNSDISRMMRQMERVEID